MRNTQWQPVNISFTPVSSRFLQRKCACGGSASSSLTGECEECKKKNLSLQRKLTIGASNDPLEQEADRVADQVLAAPSHSAVSTAPPRIQRFTGQVTGDAGTAPASVDRVLSGSGRPLDPTLQRNMGRRFGHDFSRVRVHTGAAAEKSAQDVNARAYTVGRNVVFGAGQYKPWAREGKWLIAHELAHAMQQSSSSNELVQRTLRVENPNARLAGAPPKEHWEDVRDFVTTLAPGFGVNSTGSITPVSPAVCAAPGRSVDRCFCDIHNAADDWKIRIKEDEWPHTDDLNRRVFIHSSRSQMEFGAWGGGMQSGTRVMQQTWRVLGHELCGHAWLKQLGTHPPPNIVTSGGRIMSRPSHDPTVAVENRVAQDVLGATAPQRGVHTAPHSGESFGRVTISEFPSNSAHISGLPAGMKARFDIVEHFMNANPFVKADIVGHADAVGTTAANQALSEARAQRVRHELGGRGILSNRFNSVIGVGARDCPTASPAADSACRKVEIFMYIFEKSSLRFP